MNLNRTGQFKAIASEIGIGESGKPPKVTATIKFRIQDELRGSEWVDVVDEFLEITGYYYIQNNEGELSEFTIKTLVESLGWDGRDLTTLPCMAGTEVKITCNEQEYNGKRSIRVQWLNNINSEPGGVIKHDPAAVKSFQDKLGAKLRALAGPAPVADTRPTRPAAQQTIYNGDNVWSLFCEKFPNKKGQDQTVMWKSVVARIVGNTPDDDITSEQWAAVANEIETSARAAV